MTRASPGVADTGYDWLRGRAERHGARVALSVWRGSGVTATLTWSELLALTDWFVAGLHDQRLVPGDRVLICLPNDERFVSCLLGVQRAGGIAVPAPVPTGARIDAFRHRLRTIAADCGPGLVVTLDRWVGQISSALDRGSAAPRIIAWEALRHEDAIAPAAPARSPLAFLQYTSGSTTRPRGVAVTHEALRASCRQAAVAYAEQPGDVAVTWVPLYHDMGLITGLFRPMFTGYPSILLTPEEFVRRPDVWLDAIAHCQGTLSSAPNFAYDLCVRKVPDERLADWDLRSWRVARNAGEVVRADTMDRFTRKFAAAGFAARGFSPSYGLAEATLTVTTCGPGVPPLRVQLDPAELDHGDRPPGAARPPGAVLLSSGIPLPDTKVSVVGGRGRWQVGEIAVSGPQVFAGYWNEFAASDQVSRDTIVTGDIGFLHKGHLFVLGRVSDRFSHYGRNYYLADIASACQAVEGVRPGRIAAFVIRDPSTSKDAVCAVVELAPAVVAPTPAGLERLAVTVKRQLAAAVDLYVSQVGFLAPGQLPVTTSGKVRVAEARRRWQDGTLPILRIQEH